MKSIQRLRNVLASVALAGAMLVPTPLLASSSSAAAPTGTYGQLAPARQVAVSSLGGTAGATSSHASPFLPRNASALAAAKQRAEANAPGARTPAGPYAAGALTGASASAETVVTRFALMNLLTQERLYGLDQALEPPDTQLAAGPSNLVEMINSTGSVWTKSGTLITSFDLNKFYPLPSGYSFSDPRVIYDAPTQHWFASGLSFSPSFNGQVYLAVSQTSDPTGNWYIYVLNSNTSGIIYDQPKTGVSDDKVVVSWNSYQGESTFLGAQTIVLDKVPTLTGQTASSFLTNPDATRFSIVPAQSMSSTTTEYLTYDNADPSNSAQNMPGPTVGVIAVTGLPSQSNVIFTETDPSVPAENAPPSAHQPGGTITTNDDRFLSTVWQNGVLWTAGNDACLPSGDVAIRSCLRLTQLNTAGSSPTLGQVFDYGVRGFDLYFPAVALDSSTDLVVAFTASSSTLPASVISSAQLATAPANSMGSPVVVALGRGTYSGSRWGDYSGAATDPADPTKVWTTGEFVPFGYSVYRSIWGTATGEVSAK